PLYEKLNGRAAWMVGRRDRIVSVAGEREIKGFDEGAGRKVVRDNDIAAQCNTLAGENRLDRMQLFTEAQRNLVSLARPWIADRRNLEPPLPTGRGGIIGEPIKMDERIARKVAGLADRRSFGQQLRAAHGIKLIAKNLVRPAVRR